MGIDAMIDQRKTLMGEVNDLIDKGEIDAANAKMEEVKALDAKIEAAIVAKKNAEALANAAPAVDPVSQGVSAGVLTADGAPCDVHALGDVTAITAADNSDKIEKQYENAWARHALGRSTAKDDEFIENYNAKRREEVKNEGAITTTSSAGIFVPKTVSKSIWDDTYISSPLWADCSKTHIKGEFDLPVSVSSTDAAWYEETGEIADGDETFDFIHMGKCELARCISLSWLMKNMSEAEFIAFVIKKMGEKMGAACSYGAVRGKGKPSDTEPEPWKPEPMGIITALEAESKKPHIISCANTAEDTVFDAMIKANGVINSNYARGTNIYVGNDTLWNIIAPIKYADGRLVFIPDANADGGIGRIFGKNVKIETAMQLGEILYQNPALYQANVNKDITMEIEDSKRRRKTDYIGYGIVDGRPASTAGSCLVKIKTT